MEPKKTKKESSRPTYCRSRCVTKTAIYSLDEKIIAIRKAINDHAMKSESQLGRIGQYLEHQIDESERSFFDRFDSAGTAELMLVIGAAFGFMNAMYVVASLVVKAILLMFS